MRLPAVPRLFPRIRNRPLPPAPVLLAGAVLCLALFWARGCPAGELCLEDFSRMEAGAFPRGWKIVGPFKTSYYLIQSDGQVFLEAKPGRNARAIGKKVCYEVSEYPYLSWRWRVMALPQGADERRKATGDSAAAVIVAFSGSPMPRAIRYVWSSSLPKGTVVKSPFKPRNMLVVVRNQEDPLNTWLEEKVDLRARCEKDLSGRSGSGKGHRHPERRGQHLLHRRGSLPELDRSE